MDKSSNKQSLLSRCYDLRSLLQSLKTIGAQFQKERELELVIDSDQTSCHNISDLTRDFLKLLDSQNTWSSFEKQGLIFCKEIRALNFSNQTENEATTSVNKTLKESVDYEKIERAEQATHQLMSLIGEKAIHEAELKETLTNLEILEGNYESMVSLQQKNEESRIQTVDKSKKSQMTSNDKYVVSSSVKEENKLSLKKTKSAEHKMQKPLQASSLHLIVVFEHTGRKHMLEVREYMEQLLNGFLQKVIPARATLVTFDDKVFKIEKINDNKVVLPQLEKTGIVFRKYNDNEPNYELITESIKPLISCGGQNKNKTIAVLISQGQKFVKSFPRTQDLTKIDPYFKMFMLGVSPKDGYNFSFWEGLSNSINGSSRNQSACQDFYEVVRDRKDAEDCFNKFQAAIAIEQSEGSTSIKDSTYQASQKVSNALDAQEQRVKDQIKASIDKSQTDVLAYKEISTNTNKKNAISRFESKQNQLAQQIENILRIKGQLYQYELALTSKITETDFLINKCQQQEQVDEQKQRQAQQRALTSDQSWALGKILVEIQQYSSAKQKVSKCICNLEDTISKVYCTNTSEDTSILKQDVLIKISDLQRLVE